MMLRAPLLASLAATLAACSLAPPDSTGQADLRAAPETGGTVSAADPRAQAAGEAILAQGGNAVDAAIAVMLALTVVEPQSSGIGGGGFMVLGEPDGDVTTYDGRETAPSGAGPDWFLSEDGSLPTFDESVLSGLSVGVPGNLALAAKAHEERGRLAWSELFAPAIALAREGFIVNPRFNQSLSGNPERGGASAFGRATFYDAGGMAMPVGVKIVNDELAETLERVGTLGASHFYEGQYADKLAATVAAETQNAGAMTAEDVSSYEAKERGAVCGDYRGYRVCGMGPPSSGGVAVIQILGQLERFDLAQLGVRNPVTWHLFAESQKLAYADRELYLADDDYVTVPVAGLVDPAYLASRSALIAADDTITSASAGVPAGAPQAQADGNEPPESGTSHFAVVDADGTMVSYTSTVEGPFGSGITFGGFYLNNELTDFSRSPEVDGKLVANRVEGGKRPRSSMAPTVVYAPDGKPFLAIGAAGGATIPVQTARAIIGIIDFGLPVKEALGLPFVMSYGDRLLVEKGTWLENEQEALRALSHRDIVAASPPLKAGAVHWNGERWVAARDPRLDGLVEVPLR